MMAEKDDVIEREYVINVRREILKVPRYKRAKKAVKAIREFLVRHMKVRDRDLNKVKIDKYLNEEIWFRGIKNPPTRIKVRATKKGEKVFAELLDIPDVVKFKMEREKRKKEEEKLKEKVEKKEEKKESVGKKDEEEKIEEKEKEKSSIEAGLKEQKMEAKAKKHTIKESHSKKTSPVQKKLK